MKKYLLNIIMDKSHKSHLEKFGKVYNAFVDELVSNYPYVTKKYAKFRKSKEVSLTPDIVLKYFLKSTFPFMNDISTRNEDAFMYKNNGAEIVYGITFMSIWDKSTSTNKNVIWKYLQTLYLHMKNIPFEQFADEMNDEYVDIRKSIYENEVDIINNMIAAPVDTVPVPVPVPVATDMITVPTSAPTSVPSSQKSSKPMDPTTMFEGTEIGRLATDMAKDLVAEIGEEKLKSMENPADLFKLLAGDTSDTSGNMASLMKTMFSKVDSKLKDRKLKPEDLLKESEQLMKNMPFDIEKMMKMFGGGSGGGGGGSGGGSGGDMANMMKMFGGMMGPK
jgi:hypothetical protein